MKNNKTKITTIVITATAIIISVLLLAFKGSIQHYLTNAEAFYPQFNKSEIYDILNPKVNPNIALNDAIFKKYHFTPELGYYSINPYQGMQNDMIFEDYNGIKMFVFTTNNNLPKNKQRIFVIYESEKKIATQYIVNNQELQFKQIQKSVWRFWIE